MELDIKTIICPNCGASSHNHHNCEYCGSLLVRFVSQNKTIDEQRYGKEAKPLPGLEDELKKNLSLQKTCGDSYAIVTTILTEHEDIVIVYGQVMPPFVRLNNGTVLKLSQANDENGLVYVIPFQTKSMDTDIATMEKKRLAMFKTLDYFFLFEPQPIQDGVRYIIDFGQDYESAARIISDYLREDDNDSSYSFETNMLSNEKIEIDEETGFIIAPEISQESQKKKVFIKALIGALLPLAIYIFVKVIFA